MILSNHKNIVGIKEAVNQTQRFKELVSISHSNETFKVYSGDDPTFLQFLKEGGHGVISVAANVIPKAISSICLAIREGNIEDANEINKKYSELYDLLFIESNPIPVKWVLYKMGLIRNSLRLPLVSLDKKYEENIMSEMLKLKLL
jgi:4-hydroxy-tetrahydrodipicolinate synthase